jgi:hypothetical protein
MAAVKKKIIAWIIVFVVIGIVSVMNGSSGNSALSKEDVLAGKNADTAVKFTEYIHNYACKKGKIEFDRRFFRIPVEDRERILTELQKIDELGSPEKVTVPATGQTRRFVYYRKDDRHFYKFQLRNSENRWFFHDLAVVEK